MTCFSRFQEALLLRNLFWRTDVRMARLQPFFPGSRGKPRGDGRRILTGMIFISRNDLRWRDAPAAYGPPKTPCNRWKRWSERGVFAGIFEGLAAEATGKTTVRIDATCLKAHRTASRLRSRKGDADGLAGGPAAA